MGNNKLIGIIIDDQTNMDMLAWSILYLSGQEKYYYAGFDYWFDLSDNPINENTKQIEIEIDGSTELSDFTEKLTQIKESVIGTGSKLICTRVSSIRKIDSEVIDLMHSECDYVLVLGSYNTPNLYKNKISNLPDELDDYLGEYFGDAMTSWDDAKNTPWDKREFIALNHRPFTNTSVIADVVDLSKPHFYIHPLDLYLNFKSVLPSLFNFLEIELRDDLMANWETIYKSWVDLQADQISWDTNFHIIVDYIVKGYSMDLTRFNLDLLREATILHELLYKHNLNIKAYGLEELPKNTRAIHELLEPNFHPLTAY